MLLSTGDITHVQCVWCPAVFVIAFPKWCTFAFCDYRAQPPLSVLILMLSGRYRNECLRLDHSVDSVWPANIQNVFLSVSVMDSYLDWIPASPCRVVHDHFYYRCSSECWVCLPFFPLWKWLTCIFCVWRFSSCEVLEGIPMDATMLHLFTISSFFLFSYHFERVCICSSCLLCVSWCILNGTCSTMRHV